MWTRAGARPCSITLLSVINPTARDQCQAAYKSFSNDSCTDGIHRWAHPKALLSPLCSDFDSGGHDSSAHHDHDHASPGLPRFGITGIVLASVLAVLCIAATIGEQQQKPCDIASGTCIVDFTADLQHAHVVINSISHLLTLKHINGSHFGALTRTHPVCAAALQRCV